jgi:hypothetical protein
MPSLAGVLHQEAGTLLLVNALEGTLLRMLLPTWRVVWAEGETHPERTPELGWAGIEKIQDEMVDRRFVFAGAPLSHSPMWVSLSRKAWFGTGQ